MKSLSDALPPEIAQHIHPAWRQNEIAYWANRDTLLLSYRHQWIGFANGQVIAAGASAVDVLHAAHASGLHPFVTCVGHEHEPCRIRRVAFSYDATYPQEALPVTTVEFRQHVAAPGVVLDRVSPDTGADASALPRSDCVRVPLDPSQGTPGLLGGVGATTAPTVVFAAWARLDGQDYPCRLHADFTGQERILGRDVLNRMDVLFRGPAQEVAVNP
jgi:hypothetical protein